MTPAGVVTEFPLSTSLAGPTSIAAGPDGNLWASLRDIQKIARITTDGVVTEFPSNGDTDGIFAGPDGNLWLGQIGVNKIGRMTPQGVLTEFPMPAGSTAPITSNPAPTETCGTARGTRSAR